MISSHDFDGVPADLVGRAQAMRATGAEVVKIAVKTSTLTDCLPLLDLGAQVARQATVLIGMGECGLATRVLARKFGSLWTYAGDQRQVGQLTPSDLVDTYRFRSLSETTDVYGLVGSPISHSVSPAMHNAAFGATRYDAVYLPFTAASAEDFVTFGRALGVKGASVDSVQGRAVRSVDEVYAVARRIGAINTIRAIDGRWVGGNTDAAGFLSPASRSRRAQRRARRGAPGRRSRPRCRRRARLQQRAGHDLRAGPRQSPDVAMTASAAAAPLRRPSAAGIFSRQLRRPSACIRKPTRRRSSRSSSPAVTSSDLV